MSDCFPPHGQASLSITNSWSSLKRMSIELIMRSNHLILCRPLFLLPSIFLSTRVFINESALHIMWPKFWSFSFNNSPVNIQDLFPLGWTGWISLPSKGLSKVFSNTTVQKHQLSGTQLTSPALTSTCSVQTVASWPAYTFLRRQVRWSGIPIFFRIFHSLLWSTQSKLCCCCC